MPSKHLATKVVVDVRFHPFSGAHVQQRRYASTSVTFEQIFAVLMCLPNLTTVEKRALDSPGLSINAVPLSEEASTLPHGFEQLEPSATS